MYYVAYGSNLNIEDMNNRAPNNKVIGSSILPGYKLVFKGKENNSYLTIEKDKYSYVPIGIYKITKNDLLKLDKYEGYPNLYKRKVLIIKLNNKKIPAITYVMRNNYSINTPSYEYLKTCFRGYQDFNLDLNILYNAYNESKNYKLKERIKK